MKNHMLFACLFALSGLHAQQSLILTTGNNAYRAGDSLIKQQVVYRDPGSTGRNLTWDFRHLQTIDQEYTLRYFIPDSTQMNRICGMEHRTRYYSELTADSLWSSGYENATTYMEYPLRELRLRFPFTYGDTLCSAFRGKGEYGRRLPLSVKGYTRVHADAEGELILPDETVKKALRVRTLRHYTETGKDSLHMLHDTYSWYAQGVRYPVFESIRTTLVKGEADTTVFTTSFYYPPIEQHMQVDSPPVEELEGANPLDELEGAFAVFTEAQLLPNPVTDILNINYKLTREARINFTLHNNAGISMLQTSPQSKSEGYHTTPVNMSGFIPGVYTLYVHVDDMVLTLNVVKR